MIFTIPVSIVGATGNNQLTVELPLIGFKKTFLISDNKIIFEANAGRKPQKLIISYCSSAVNTCIVFQPTVDSKSKTAPVRTISLKKNNVEIAVPIDGLPEQWNYKSWADAWLTNGDHLVYRYYWDYEAVRNTQS